MDKQLVEQYTDHPLGLEQVYNVAKLVSEQVPEDCIFMETGTRAGGSALAILQAIKDSGKNRWLFTLDPYGDKPYNVGNAVTQLWYGEEFYRTAMKVLADYAFDNKLLHAHFRMKSLDWMNTFSTTEYWYEATQQNPKFGFAYLDGDHDTKTVEAEYAWLKERSPGIAVIVDDAQYLEESTLKLGKVIDGRLFINCPDIT